MEWSISIPDANNAARRRLSSDGSGRATFRRAFYLSATGTMKGCEPLKSIRRWGYLYARGATRVSRPPRRRRCRVSQIGRVQLPHFLRILHKNVLFRRSPELKATVFINLPGSFGTPIFFCFKSPPEGLLRLSVMFTK